jgi:hypothetical protein
MFATSYPAICLEKDFLKRSLLSLIGTAEYVEALFGFALFSNDPTVDNRIAALYKGFTAIGYGLIGLETGEDVVVEVSSRSGVRQIRRFTEQGAQEMDRVILPRRLARRNEI